MFLPDANRSIVCGGIMGERKELSVGNGWMDEWMDGLAPDRYSLNGLDNVDGYIMYVLE